MKRMSRLQPVRAFLLSVSAVALIWAVAVPHCRFDVDESAAVDDSTSFDSDGFLKTVPVPNALSALAPDFQVAEIVPALVAFHQILQQNERPRTILVVRATSPRAPPVLPS